MDLFSAGRRYIDEFINRKNSKAKPGMKALLLDRHTAPQVSMLYAQSEILQNEVYLNVQIDEPSPWKSHLDEVTALVLIRPCAKSFAAIDKELRNPRFQHYDICFTNVVDPRDLEKLAAADQYRRVDQVMEYFLDYFVIDPHLFSLNLMACGSPGGKRWGQGLLEASAKGLHSVMLALDRFPIVRYQTSSAMCKELAERVSRLVAANTDTDCLLLVIDRRDDPITPLLNQWTYQAMVHELLGIENGKVNVDSGKSQIILTSGRDKFFANSMYTTYDVLTHNVQRLVEEYKKAKDKKLDTLDQMKKFIEEYSKIKEVAESASKHLSLVHAIKVIVEKHALLPEVADDGICLFEQELLDCTDHGYAFKRLTHLMSDTSARPIDKIRLVLLYLLRFEKNRNLKLEQCVQMLHDENVPQPLRKAVPALLQYCGNGCAGRDGNDAFASATDRGFAVGVTETALMRHSPLLVKTLQQLSSGKLSKSKFQPLDSTTATNSIPAEVVIFMVGGATYEEAKVVQQFNQVNPGIRVVLGGTHIHNTTSFLEEICVSTGV
eukprot:m.97422 g.97422  ORF g.97422 m.97422 type:complete len:549 (-) comp26976_c0_seq5:151-1797(-)